MSYPLTDDEVLYRRIPPGDTFQVPPSGRIASGNFTLRHDLNEVGLSVGRANFMTAAELVGRQPPPTDGWRVAAATVAEIRRLGLDVVPVPLPDNPGHAEIRSGSGNLDTRSTRRKLAAVFQYVL